MQVVYYVSVLYVSVPYVSASHVTVPYVIVPYVNVPYASVPCGCSSPAYRGREEEVFSCQELVLPYHLRAADVVRPAGAPALAHPGPASAAVS